MSRSIHITRASPDMPGVVDSIARKDAETTKSAPATTQRGRNTIERILCAAIDTFADKGYGELSMRKIAGRAGISLSNLQFHFKTREDLLGAVITRLASSYIEQYRTLARNAHLSSSERLEAALRHTLEGNREPRTQSIFFNMWAIAQTHECARSIVEKIYVAQREEIARFIGEANPRLSAHDCSLRAALISCQIEGLMSLIPAREVYPHGS
ncbi:TetR/AcrR family transcriptional regulator [Paraburkholderia bannensis]|uniref:TetR/AcrR family transcriptional regulator n=1 Tax=Paraburkholderia bannensis TaxID=765414 RepID=UPI002AB7B5E7|nr:TetR/AcrR family transcriptional regulator [Paraburkholderia bannensis]